MPAQTSLANAIVPTLWTGAENQSFTEFAKSHLTVSLMDFIPVAQRAAIRAYTSTYDCISAWDEAVAAFLSTSTTQGGIIFIPAGLYNFSTTRHLKNRVFIIGEGSGGYDDAAQITRLKFAANQSGFVIHRSDTYSGGRLSTATTSGEGSRIEGCYIQGSGTSGKGVWMRAAGVVRDCTIDGFGEYCGYIAAQVATSDDFLYGNANRFHLDNVTFVNAGSHGCYIKGHDANAGSIIGCKFDDNGGWGLLDECFLGNHIFGCDANGNTSGPYKINDAASQGILVGCDSGASQGSGSELSARAMIFGGNHQAGFNISGGSVNTDIGNWADIENGFAIDRGRISGGFVVGIGTTAGSRQNLSVMKSADAPMAFCFENDDANGYRWKFDTPTGCWVRMHGTTIFEYLTTSLSAAAASNPVDESAADIAAANLVYPRGVWFPSISDQGENRKFQYTSGNGAGASINTGGNVTYTAANILTGAIVRDCNGAGRTDTLPTAALLVAAIQNTAQVGQIIECLLINGSDAAEAITLLAGTGGSFNANQTVASRVVPQNTSRRLRIRLTNVSAGTESYGVVM